MGRTGVSLLVAPPRAAARRCAAHGAVDETRRARDHGASAAVDRAPRDRRGLRRRRHCDRSGARAGRGAAQRLRRPAARLGPARPCVARRSSAGQRVGPRREPDRAVVDGERGRARRVRCTRAPGASSCSRCRSRAARPVSRGTRASEFPVSAAACPIRRASSTRVRTGSCARGRRPCRAAGRPSPRSSSTRRRKRPSSAASRSWATASTRPTSTTHGSTSTTGTGDRVVLPGAFVDREIPSWYAPFGIQAIGGHVFVTYVYARR